LLHPIRSVISCQKPFTGKKGTGSKLIL